MRGADVHADAWAGDDGDDGDADGGLPANASQAAGTTGGVGRDSVQHREPQV